MQDLKDIILNEGGYLLFKGEKLPVSFYNKFYTSKCEKSKSLWENWKAKKKLKTELKQGFEEQSSCERELCFFFFLVLKKGKSLFYTDAQVQDTLKIVGLQMAIKELETHPEDLIVSPSRLCYGVQPVISLPYGSAKSKRHFEPSLDIFCEHGEQSDVRFHYHSFARENKCNPYKDIGRCTFKDENEKSRKFVLAGIEIMKVLREISDGSYNPPTIEELVVYHNELTKNLNVT